MIVVQEQPIFRRYLSPFISVATIFQLVCAAASIVVPFIIAFGTSGMWLKFNVVEQQPLITFLPPIVILLQINTTNVQYRTASPDAATLDASSDNTRLASITASQTDSNNDQRPDLFSLRFELPKDANDLVFGVQIFAPHTCYLDEPFRTQFSSMLLFQRSTSIPSNRLAIDGTLRVKAREPIETWSVAVEQNDDIASAWNNVRFDFGVPNSIETLISSLETANLKTEYNVAFHVWQPESDISASLLSSATNTSFVIDILIRVPREMLPYRPGLGELCKWAYMQWIAFFFPVWLIIRAIKRTAFYYNMLGSIPVPVDNLQAASPAYTAFK